MQRGARNYEKVQRSARRWEEVQGTSGNGARNSNKCKEVQGNARN